MRDKIKLVSTAGTGHFYTTTKNKKNTTEKLLFKKYDPVARKHVDYKEAKIKWVKLTDNVPFKGCYLLIFSNFLQIDFGK